MVSGSDFPLNNQSLDSFLQDRFVDTTDLWDLHWPFEHCTWTVAVQRCSAADTRHGEYV